MITISADQLYTLTLVWKSILKKKQNNVCDNKPIH